MSDPFRIEGPAIINVSGGRTSALMLRRVLDAHGGALPDGVVAAFANTGDEHPRTYDFVRALTDRWGVPIVWLERDGKAPAGRRFRVVDHATASRDAGPFRELIRERRYLPNAVTRFCSQSLKIETARDFMRSLGHEHWTSVIGLRADEAARVAKHRERNDAEDEFTSAYPLHAAGIMKAHVTRFWKAQPFDLGLEWWESNCRMCFQKGASILERTERDAPGSLAWAAEEEARLGATFTKGRRYLTIINRAQRPMLPGLDVDPEGVVLPCSCTDRRPPRWRCICGPRRNRFERGHTLLCVLARDAARRAA